MSDNFNPASSATSGHARVSEGQVSGSALQNFETRWRGGMMAMITCIALGIICLLIGFFNLFGNIEVLGAIRDTNLAIGETFCIMGAIFLVGGIRPRN